MFEEPLFTALCELEESATQGVASFHILPPYPASQESTQRVWPRSNVQRERVYISAPIILPVHQSKPRESFNLVVLPVECNLMPDRRRPRMNPRCNHHAQIIPRPVARPERRLRHQRTPVQIRASTHAPARTL